MEKMSSKLQELKNHILHRMPTEGAKNMALNNVVLFRSSEGQPRQQEVYQAYILMLVQGEKRLHIGGKQVDFKEGEYLAVFMPMLLEAERADVSEENPYLMVCIEVDLSRFANLLLKLDTLASPAPPADTPYADVFHKAQMPDHLLDPVIRLLQAFDNPTDVAILGDSIIDEIYYRLLRDEQAGFGSFRHHFEQRGQIQQIARAVNHIQANLDSVVSVEHLAQVSNMSVSGFHRIFKEVMHATPLQYAKTLKLHRAAALLHAGQTASEASYSVGYNSPAQFSREFKRFFGYSPSATRATAL